MKSPLIGGAAVGFLGAANHNMHNSQHKIPIV